MNDAIKVVNEFYAAFARKDGPGMVACYAEDVIFWDPVFKTLNGKDAKGMWSMLCGKASDLKVTYKILGVSGDVVKVYWIATYRFSKTGRSVCNKIKAELEVKDGKIVRHTDRFNFWRWASQALGIPGLLLGWTPVLKNSVHQQARASLNAYMHVKKT